MGVHRKENVISQKYFFTGACTGRKMNKNSTSTMGIKIYFSENATWFWTLIWCGTLRPARLMSNAFLYTTKS